MFNQAHSTLRSVIERTFKVWKSRWNLLESMPSFSFDIQVAIRVASMAICNYIRRTIEDLEYDWYVYQENQNGSQVQHATITPNGKEMDELQDQLAPEIAAGIRSQW